VLNIFVVFEICYSSWIIELTTGINCLKTTYISPLRRPLMKLRKTMLHFGFESVCVVIIFILHIEIVFVYLCITILGDCEKEWELKLRRFGFSVWFWLSLYLKTQLLLLLRVRSYIILVTVNNVLQGVSKKAVLA
jgi:hypothetical protein